MKALEFQARINPDDTVTIPAHVAEQVRGDEPVRVILLVPDSAEDEDWSRMTAEQFLKGYAEGDTIYDKLPGG